MRKKMYTLLFVDDEEEIRKSIISMVDFESAGFKLIGEASNGIEALDLVEKYNPDLVLTDVKMPYMSGTELAREILTIHPSVSVAFLTGCDDFQTAKQAVEYNIAGYILKPVTANELIEQLVKIKNRMESRKGELTSTSATNMEALAIEQKKQLNLMWVALDERNSLGDENSIKLINSTLTELGLFHENYCYTVVLTKQKEGKTPLTARFVDGIMRKYFISQSFEMGNTVFTLVNSTKEDRQNYLSGAVREISETSEKYYGVKTYSGLSGIITNPKHIFRSFKEAQLALKNLESEGIETEEISYASDIEKKSNAVNNMFITQVGEQIEQILKAGTKGEVAEFLTASFSKAFRKNVDMGLFSMEIMLSIYRSVSSITDNQPPVELMQNSFFSEAVNNLGLSKAQDNIEKLCIKAKDFIDEQKKNSQEQIGAKAINIINERFSDPYLTLQSLSEELYCSVPYLSTLIKKQFGNTFINLLTKRRMEKAKQLIMGSIMKMSEISQRCGYIDQQYFSYCFKKYYGLSPLKAREAGI